MSKMADSAWNCRADEIAGQDADPHDLHQVTDFLGAKARQGVEDRLAVGLFHVHSVHEQTVPVRI
jgi:hypothetical protein